MNSDFQNLPPEERAARLTALLLGELSAAEAEAVRLALVTDAELAREHDRLQQTIALVRETAALERRISSEGTPLRLDDQRREKLLASFKTPAVAAPAVVPAAAPRRARNLQFLPLALAAALVGLLVASVMLPSLAKSKAKASGLSLNLATGGRAHYSRAADSELYFDSDVAARRSGRGEVEKLAKRESEVALAENFSEEFTRPTPGAPVSDPARASQSASSRVGDRRSERPVVALALPALADTDGEARESKQLTEGFAVASWAIKPLPESLVRADVSRGLARGNEVASGNTRGFFDNSSSFNAPAPATPVPASQPVSNNRWDDNQLAVGGSFTFTPSTATANLGTLWAETGVDQRASIVTGESELNRSQLVPAPVPLVGNPANEAMYLNGSFSGRDSFASSDSGSSVQPKAASALNAEQAQSIIEARRSQSGKTSTSLGNVMDDGAAQVVNGSVIVRNSLAPSTPAVPPPAPAAPVATASPAQMVQDGKLLYETGRTKEAEETLRQALKLEPENKAAAYFLDLANARTHVTEARLREINSKKLLAEVEQAWSDPVRKEQLGTSPGTTPEQPAPPSVSPGLVGGIGGFGGGGGRGGGRGRAGLVGGSSATPAQNGATYAGVSIAPGGQPNLAGRNLTDLTAVERKMDGLQDAPLAAASEPQSFRRRLANEPSGVQALGVEFESKTKAVEDRFGRADDFDVTPEMLDAVKLQIQNAPSSAGVAGAARSKDNLSANNPLPATTPNFSSGGQRFYRMRIEGSGAPAQGAVPPASGPAVEGVTAHDFIAMDTLSAYLTVNDPAPANAAVNYFSDLPATAGDNTLAWKFNGNDSWFGANASGGGIGSLVQPMGERAEKQSGLKSDANGRVEVQLPAVVDGGLHFQGELSPDQSNRDKAEVRAKLRQSLESEVTKWEAADGTVRFSKQLAATSAPAIQGTNLVAVAAKPVSSTEPELVKKVSAPAPTPQPEVLARDNAFSTFSLNVADVSFKLAAASLEKGALPDVAGIRSEEFINAFDYRDPVPSAGVPLAFVSERARYPFAHHRDALRFSIKTAAQGRDGGRPLNIVLLLDNSGSMERADRVGIIREALRALAVQLQPQDKLSVVAFSRTARLWADGVTGAQAAEIAGKVSALTPEGGTNLEEALDLAYRTALRHYAPTAMNRVVLLTDGAANLGNVEPAALKSKVENFRKQGVALDCFGIGWEGFNDDLLEQLSRNGDGRYGFVNSPEEAATEFAGQLAGALQVAASDVKVQVEFNPKRVTAWRQVGYAKHQLTKEQFRDNKVDAAEISASEAGNALYIIETNPRGEGPVATVRARFRVPQTSDYREHEWVVPFGSAVELEQSSSALRLATGAAAFSEWLAGSPFAGEVTTDRLLGLLNGVPEVYGADPRPKKLEWMIRQAKSISGK